MSATEIGTAAEPLSAISHTPRRRRPSVHVNVRMREYYRRLQLRLQNNPELRAKYAAKQRAKYKRWMTRMKAEEPERWQRMKARAHEQSREYQRRRWLRLRQLLQKYNE